eukprot:1370207-Pyramimonas_sp.AAC.1
MRSTPLRIHRAPAHCSAFPRPAVVGKTISRYGAWNASCFELSRLTMGRRARRDVMRRFMERCSIGARCRAIREATGAFLKAGPQVLASFPRSCQLV